MPFHLRSHPIRPIAFGAVAALASRIAEPGRRPICCAGDRGEGVISTAIAVLIVAFIGAAMWVAFDQIWADTQVGIQREVGNIGGGSAP